VRSGALAIAAALAQSVGCTPSPPYDRLVVATSWPPSVRLKLETEFERWVQASRDRVGDRRVRVEWLVLAPQEETLKLACRATPPDVLLGGRPKIFELLASMDRLSPIEHARQARWCSIPRPPDTEPAAPVSRGCWLDPREDPVSLGSVRDELTERGWRGGYAQLVQSAADARRAGRAADWDTATATPWETSSFRRREFGPGAGKFLGIEGVAVTTRSREPALAQGFLRFLVETQNATELGNKDALVTGLPAQQSSLLADLFGSTLVDAQDELWMASRAIEGLANREQAVKWLSEPPPWPPASVAKYLGREGERAMALIETLLTEVAPDPASRAWLLRSWLEPARPVDEFLLLDLAEAADGQLCREPRFRAWLREEWTAWARQRYRRVARWAAAQPST
jgi:hypothetical protein